MSESAHQLLLRGLSAPPEVPMFEAANHQRSIGSYIIEVIVGLVTLGVGVLVIERWHKNEREENEGSFTKAIPNLLDELDTNLSKPASQRVQIAINYRGGTFVIEGTNEGFAATDSATGVSYAAKVPVDTLRTRLAKEIARRPDRYGRAEADRAKAILQNGLNDSEDWSRESVEATLATKVLNWSGNDRATAFQRLMMQVVDLDNESPQKPEALASLAKVLRELPAGAREEPFHFILQQAAELADVGLHTADEALASLAKCISSLKDTYRSDALMALLAQVVKLDAGSKYKGKALAALAKHIPSLPKSARQEAYEAISAQVAKLGRDAREASVVELAGSAFSSLQSKSQGAVFSSTLNQVVDMDNASWKKGPALNALITSLWVLPEDGSVRTFRAIQGAVNNLGQKRHKEEAMVALTDEIHRLPWQSHPETLRTMRNDVNALDNGTENKRKASLNLDKLEQVIKVDPRFR